MITGEKIVFFGGSDWWYHNPSSGIQLLKEMVKSGNQALYINNIPLRMPKPGKSGSKNRYLNKLKSYLKFLKKAEPGLWVLTPITIPGFGSARIKKTNQVLLKLQIKLAMMLIGWWAVVPLVISMTPAAGLVLPGLKRKAAVYYLCDKFDTFRDISGSQQITEMDKVVARESDVLICVSKAIQSAYIETHSAAQYVPHGANIEVFNRAVAGKLPRPDDLADIKAPIIGYFGSITESNDKEILEHMARQRPDWNIVLIGQVISDYSMFDQYPNVHFLGKKSLEELPAYGQYFDVCIMNWIMNEWISFCNPVKAKEYLAMGKPVVSVPIPEVVDTMSDVVSIAATPEEFLNAVEFELNNNSEEKAAKRLAKVDGDTWDYRSKQIFELIEKSLKGIA